MPDENDVYEFKSSPEDNAVPLNPDRSVPTNFGAAAFEKSHHGLDEEADPMEEGNLIGG
jgi:hypothetical protein